MNEFKVLFEQREEAERSLGETTRERLAVLSSQDSNIAELMAAAQELAEPDPAFFTRA
jgi:hypothetical protein